MNIEKDIQKLKEKREAISLSINEHKSQVDGLKKEWKVLKVEIAKSKGELSKIKADVASILKDKERANNVLEATQVELGAATSVLAITIDEQKEVVDEAKKAVKLAERRLLAVVKKTDELNKALEDKRAETIKLTDAVKALVG